MGEFRDTGLIQIDDSGIQLTNLDMLNQLANR
jgi:hypothetical protein